MARMFRVLSFWTFVIAVMAFWGGLQELMLIFLGNTAFFIALSYVRLSERTYLTIFNAYMVVAFVVFLYVIMFQLPLTGIVES